MSLCFVHICLVDNDLSVNSEKFSQLVNCTLDNGITSLVGMRLVAILTMALHLLADIFQLHFESSGWGK